MPELVATPSPDDEDPIDRDDPDLLRREILRVRDLLIGAGAREEVLTDLVNERDQQIVELDRTVQNLSAELARNPLMRFARAALRRLRR